MSNQSPGAINIVRKKFHKTHELISTSYHEAGHTIYGLLHFMKIESVCVFEDKKSKRIDGITHYNSPTIEDLKNSDLIKECVNAEICLSYSGLVAEKYYFKLISGSDKFPMFLKEGSSDDTTQAANFINKYEIVPPGRKRYEYKKKLIRGVSKELQNNWDAVTLIAHGLFQKKKFYFSDLKDLLTKKTKNKDFWKEQFKIIANLYEQAGNVSESELKKLFNI